MKAPVWLIDTQARVGTPVALLALYLELGPRAYLALTGQRV